VSAAPHALHNGDGHPLPARTGHTVPEAADPLPAGRDALSAHPDALHDGDGHPLPTGCHPMPDTADSLPAGRDALSPGGYALHVRNRNSVSHRRDAVPDARNVLSAGRNAMSADADRVPGGDNALSGYRQLVPPQHHMSCGRNTVSNRAMKAQA